MSFTPGQKLTAADLNTLANIARGEQIPTNDRQFTHTPTGTLEQKFDVFSEQAVKIPTPFDIKTIPYTTDDWNTHRTAIWLYINNTFDTPTFITYNQVPAKTIGSLKYSNLDQQVKFAYYNFGGFDKTKPYDYSARELRSNGEGWIYSGMDVEDVFNINKIVPGVEAIRSKIFGTFLGLQSINPNDSGETDIAIMFLLMDTRIVETIHDLMQRGEFVVGWLKSIIGTVTLDIPAVGYADFEVTGIDLGGMITTHSVTYDASEFGNTDGLIHNYFSKYRSSIDVTSKLNIPWEINTFDLKIYRATARIGNKTVECQVPQNQPYLSAYIGKNYCVADLSACTIQLSDEYVEDYTHSSILVAEILSSGPIIYWNNCPHFPCWEFYSNADISAPAY